MDRPHRHKAQNNFVAWEFFGCATAIASLHILDAEHLQPQVRFWVCWAISLHNDLRWRSGLSTLLQKWKSCVSLLTLALGFVVPEGLHLNHPQQARPRQTLWYPCHVQKVWHKSGALSNRFVRKLHKQLHNEISHFQLWGNCWTVCHSWTSIHDMRNFAQCCVFPMLLTFEVRLGSLGVKPFFDIRNKKNVDSEHGSWNYLDQWSQTRKVDRSMVL